MPGRDRRAGDRDADRLEDVLGLDVAAPRPRRAAPARCARRRRARRPRAPSRAVAPARSRPPSSQPLLARGRVVGRRLEEEAGQRPEVRQRLDLLLGDRDGRRAGPSRPVSSSSRPRQLLGRQLAHVAAVHPAQLLLVEDAPGCATRARCRSARPARSVGDERLVVVVAPAEQREVVAHRLGQVAGVAQLLHRRGAVALGELLAVGAVQQRQVRVARAARRRAPRARAAAWACWRGGPRRGRRG